jgi:hypothetical protein
VFKLRKKIHPIYQWGSGRKEEGEMVQFVYALISISVVALVIIFGVGGRSNYVPSREIEELGQTREGGESDVSTD